MVQKSKSDSQSSYFATQHVKHDAQMVNQWHIMTPICSPSLLGPRRLKFPHDLFASADGGDMKLNPNRCALASSLFFARAELEPNKTDTVASF